MFALSVPSQVNSNPVSDYASAHVFTSNSTHSTRAVSLSNTTNKSHIYSFELDSSILAPYGESSALDSDEAFSYTSTADKSLQPFSDAFFHCFLDALGLDASLVQISCLTSSLCCININMFFICQTLHFLLLKVSPTAYRLGILFRFIAYHLQGAPHGGIYLLSLTTVLVTFRRSIT